MRVLYFVGTLELGGLERFVTRVSLEARKTGAFEPIVCCLNHKSGPFLTFLDDANIQVIEAPNNWSRSISSLIGLSHEIKKTNPDIVHSQVDFSIGQQRLAVLFAGFRIKFFVTERSEYVLKGFSRIRRIIQFYFLKFMGVDYTANSTSGAHHLAKQVGIDPQKIGVIPNGTPIIETDILVRNKIRNELGCEDSEFLLGYVARLANGKGHELFIKSIKKLKSKGFSIKACLAGDGPKFFEIKDLIRTLDLESDVIMLGSVLNVSDYLQAFDAVALLSEREGMPNALLEAMAAGRPVIATKVGGMPEILDYGRAGILVDRNLRSVVQGIETLLKDYDLRLALGERARDKIKVQYGLEKTFRMLVNYYKSWLENA